MSESKDTSADDNGTEARSRFQNGCSAHEQAKTHRRRHPARGTNNPVDRTGGKRLPVTCIVLLVKMIASVRALCLKSPRKEVWYGDSE